MERAFDTFQNQLVFALDCERESYFPDRFVCPCCEKGVFFAAGVVQKPHFKHATGYDPACEHAVAGIARGTFGDIEAEPRDASIVAQFSTRSGGPSCSFAIRYKPVHPIESINVVMGAHDKDYQLHGRREIDVPVTEAAEVIVISAFAADQVIVRRFVKAFGKTPAVFRRTSGQSIKIPSNRILHPGDYVAVFKNEYQIQFPLLCEAVQIGCPLGLKAYAFVIPANPNMRVLDFCRDAFGMSVRVRHFDYALLEPLALIEESPDVWATSTETEVALLIASKTQIGATTNIVAQFRERIKLHTRSEVIKLSATPHLLKFAVGKEQPLIRIGIGSPPQFLAEIRYLASIPEPTTTRFRFRFRHEASAETFKLCRSSWQLHSMFDKVRNGEVSVEAIEHSPFVELAAVSRFKRTELAGDSAGMVLTELLREQTGALRVLATGYPAIFVPSRSQSDKPKGPEARLFSSTRRPITRRRRHTRAQLLGISSRYSALAQSS